MFQVSMLNINNNQNVDFSPVKIVEQNENESFFNVLENKLDVNETEDYSSRIDSQYENGQDKKEMKALSDTLKKIEKKIEELENSKDEKGEMQLSALKRLYHNIMLLLEQMKKIDKVQITDLLKEFTSIKSDLKDLLKGKDIKDEQMFRRLKNLLNELRKIFSNKQDKVQVQMIEKDKMDKNVLKQDKDINLKKEDSLFEKSLKSNQKGKVQKRSDTLLIKNVKIVKENLKPDSQSMFKNISNKGFSQLDVKNNITQELKENFNIKRSDIQEMINKVTKQVKISLSQQKNEVVMNLKPEFLGKVSIKMEFKGKALSAKFVVDNIYAEKVFKDQMVQLKVNFQEMGLEIENFDITLNNKRDPEQSLADFQKTHELQESFADADTTEDEWLPLVENYNDMGWIAQNINLKI